MSRRAKKPAPAPVETPLVVESTPLASPAAQLDACLEAIATRYEPPIERLGRRLVEAALTRLDHHDPDRAVALTNTYIALVTEDERARA